MVIFSCSDKILFKLFCLVVRILIYPAVEQEQAVDLAKAEMASPMMDPSKNPQLGGQLGGEGQPVPPT